MFVEGSVHGRVAQWKDLGGRELVPKKQRKQMTLTGHGPVTDSYPTQEVSCDLHSHLPEAPPTSAGRLLDVQT